MLSRVYSKLIRLSCLIACLMAISSCGSNSGLIQNLAKSDINMVGDSHIQQTNILLKSLVYKLYKRNPRELQKNGMHTIAERIEQIFSDPKNLRIAALNYRESIDAMLLSFDDSFEGDRVFALGVGLRGMFYRAYNENAELFMLDKLDSQKLYNCARNIEIVAWRLAHRRDARGELYLLTNSMDEPANLSFERLFGKLIMLQDMIAKITADRTERTINKIVHRIATAVFLPVG